jgi:hypothetical protein
MSSSSSVLRRLHCQTGLTDGAIETLAEELHGDYRAANKALSNEPETAYRGSNYKGLHDHGWSKCHKKDYFRQRAARKLLDRLKVVAKNVDLSPLTPNEQRAALLKLFGIQYVNHADSVTEIDLTTGMPEDHRDAFMKLFGIKEPNCVPTTAQRIASLTATLLDSQTDEDKKPGIRAEIERLKKGDIE